MWKRGDKKEQKTDFTQPIMVKLSWIDEEIDLLGCQWCNLYKNSECESTFLALDNSTSSTRLKNDLKKCINKNKTMFLTREAEYKKIKNENKYLLEKRVAYLQALEEEEG